MEQICTENTFMLFPLASHRGTIFPEAASENFFNNRGTLLPIVARFLQNLILI